MHRQRRKQTLLAKQRLQDVQKANAATQSALTKAQQNATEAQETGSTLPPTNARRAEQANGNAFQRERDTPRKAEQTRAEEKDKADHNLYVANMNLIQRDWDNNDVGSVLELLEATRATILPRVSSGDTGTASAIWI